VTPPDDSELLKDHVALPPRWNSQLGGCCSVFESYTKLKNVSKVVVSSVSAADIQPGSALLAWLLPDEGFPW